MLNLWTVAQREYRRTVARRGFLIGTLSIPLLMGVLAAVVFWVETSGEDRAPVGFVDLGGFIRDEAIGDASGDDAQLEVRRFPAEDQALAALEAGELQAAFVFAADYRQTGQVDVFYRQRPPTDAAVAAMRAVVRASLTADLPAEQRARLLAGSALTTVDVASGRTFSEAGVINVIIPVAGGFLLFLVNLSASGYLLRVVTEEKENRTLEVMLTSVSATELIGGKTLGLLAATLTQAGIYLLAVMIGLWVAAPYVPELQRASVPWDYLGVVALFFVPSFGLLTALMVMVGSLVPDAQQGQQFVGLLNLAYMLPIFLIAVIMEDPTQPAVTALTLFPTSAFMTIALRWGLGVVPVWELVVSWLVLVASALAVAWAAARVFRLGMLRYGQRLSLVSAWAAIRGH